MSTHFSWFRQTDWRDFTPTTMVSSRLAVIAVLAGYSLLAVRIDWHRSPMFDPALRYFIVTSPWEHILTNVTYIELAPPGWHILAKIITTLSPFSTPLTLRAVNFALYLGLIPLGYSLGRELHTWRAGLLAAALVPAHQRVFNTVPRGDHYALLVFGSLAVLLTALHYTRTESRRWLAAYAATITIYGLTHYYALPVAVSVILVGTVVVAYQYPAQRRAWVVSHVPVTVAWTAWLPRFIDQHQMYAHKMPSTVNPHAVTMHMEVISPGGSPPGYWLAAAVLLAYLAVRIYRTPVRLWPLAAIYLGTGLLITKSVVGSTITPRQAPHLPVLAALLAAIAGAMLIADARQRLTGARWRHRVVGVTVAVLLVSAVVVPYAGAAVGLQDSRWQGGFDDYSAVASQYADDEDTAVLSVLHYGEGILRFYGVDTEVWGMPVDAITADGRAHHPIHMEMAYTTADRDRLDAAVEGKERVVVFLAHGAGERSDQLIRDLKNRGFTVEKRDVPNGNGVLVLTRSSAS